MKTSVLLAVVLAGSLAAGAALATSQRPPASSPPPSAGASGQEEGQQARIETIAHLREAAQGEANAAHRYSLFARRADEEGYGQVAKLFRAASLSETIHLRNHAAVLNTLGAALPEIELSQVELKSTRENLKVPIEGEKGEAENMYPRFAQQAREAGLPDAALTFTYAGDTEKEHEKLFEDALRRLGKNPDVDYLVQSESGMLVTRAPGRVAAVTSPSKTG